ncbi:primary-amine oxidase [Amycolatopsis sp. CA-230715]|uniref:primary-amine oxidase n=1 Tax=Amycolatopsis sp. CA-230715 TaxID=2745196 RepID=UPI001C01A2A4|nr:primary-amine oxidase [Amycolatopsis sp. CA-230715]QWF85367.1 Histamine oxidase [Amycolatopsis sp. CA-230715]
MPSTPPHPLDPLTAAELEVGRAVLVAEGLVTDTTRFPQVLPEEPAKEPSPDAVDRRIRFTMLDTGTGLSGDAVVSVTKRELVSWQNCGDGQPAYLFEEYDLAQDITKASEAWLAAMTRRGLADRVEHAFCAPLAPGYFGREDERGRVIRTLTFLREHQQDSPWAHPVEGLVTHIDLTTREVLRVEDEGDVPVPSEHGRYGDVTPRTTLKPIEITQPEGPSFTVDGSEVRWEGWRLRVGFNAREGLTLHEVSFGDRPVLYRASVPEMVVPYGDTTPSRFWISYFDAGEYLLGKNANDLRLGCDCLGVIHYLPAFVADDHGHPVEIPQAICLHEEDDGILWKHTDLDQRAEVRRSRRLVLSSISTVGNYDYGFFWYLYLDGTVEFEAKATGIVFAGAGTPGDRDPHATEIAPGLFAPVHQHLFCARLDMAVDGDRNSLYEIDVAGVPIGPENPYGNAFTWHSTPLRTEHEAMRTADPARARVWEIRSADKTNRLGVPTAYQLVPRPSATLLAQPDSSVHKRATFATKHLWATPYRHDERYPAGERPGAHPGGDGLPAWTAEDRDLTDTDLVLWHVFGLTHVPRPEDWPVMPVDRAGFSLRPYGFCDRNPALDLPSGETDHCDH